MRFILIGLMVGLMTPGCAKEEPKKAPKVSVKKKNGPSRAPVRQAVVKTKQGMPTSMPASRPASRPMGKLPPGHPPMGAGASQPPGAATGGTIEGSIQLDKSQSAKVKAGSTLFIIVRRDEGEGKKGMMLAAKKIMVTGSAMFPLKYTVTPKDVMMAGTSLVGKVRVSARIDQDGDAISKQPGDVIGAAKAPVMVGDKKPADFTLDSAI